jgi:hypothetical protein
MAEYLPEPVARLAPVPQGGSAGAARMQSSVNGFRGFAI